MRIYSIEVDEQMENMINNNAKRQSVSAEQFIVQILNKYVIDAHIMDSKQVEDGYKECGEINLELANL